MNTVNTLNLCCYTVYLSAAQKMCMEENVSSLKSMERNGGAKAREASPIAKLHYIRYKFYSKRFSRTFKLT